MRKYFTIDPSHSTPRGPDILYECLKCGDIIPSTEEARGPSACTCRSITLDFDAFRATFKDPAAARGIREVHGVSAE